MTHRGLTVDELRAQVYELLAAFPTQKDFAARHAICRSALNAFLCGRVPVPPARMLAALGYRKGADGLYHQLLSKAFSHET